MTSTSSDIRMYAACEAHIVRSGVCPGVGQSVSPCVCLSAQKLKKILIRNVRDLNLNICYGEP